MTAATPTLRRIYLEDALVSTARAQRDPSEAHRTLAARRTQALELVGGMAAVSDDELDKAMATAATRLVLDERGCLCGYCPARRAA